MLQVASLPEEPMQIKMLPDLPPQPKTESEPEKLFPSDFRDITADDFKWSEVGDVAHYDSESSMDDLQVPANNLAPGQIPFPIIARDIF